MKKMFKVEDVKKMAQASDELLNRLKEVLSDNGDSDIEGLVFIHEDVSYSLADVWRDDEIDEGKYINGCNYYQLQSFDRDEASYLCEMSELESFNVCVNQGYSKCGSYFSDCEWYYDEPTVGIITIKTVPEVVIPEHEEVRIVSQ